MQYIRMYLNLSLIDKLYEELHSVTLGTKTLSFLLHCLNISGSFTYERSNFYLENSLVTFKVYFTDYF